MAVDWQELKKQQGERIKQRERIGKAVLYLKGRGNLGGHYKYLLEHLTWQEIETLLHAGMIERCGDHSYRLTEKALRKDSSDA